MKVGIVGTGPIGQGYAALLAAQGHEPILWSPRNRHTSANDAELVIVTAGAFVSRTRVRVIQSPTALAEADIVIFCIVGNAHRAVMDAVAPYLTNRQTVFVSSQCSLSALYLSRLLVRAGKDVPILATATTIVGASLRKGTIFIPMVRGEVDVAALPVTALPQGIALMRLLFGDRFVPSVDMLAITLSNLNPQIHLANAMLNFTRIEKGEHWDNFGGITESVGRLVEALDLERVAVAESFQLRVRTVHEHYLKSYDGLTPRGSVHALAQEVRRQRDSETPGPTALHTRYLTEDLPFGIAATIAIGRVAGVATPLHEAGFRLLSVACGHDFSDDNDLLPALRLDNMTAADLHRHILLGWTRGAIPSELPC